MLDFNCMVGAWPFHPLAVETFEQLQALHKKNGIESGFVTSNKSVFYRDYFYSEEELHNTLKGSNYRHVLTVNPKFPACMDIVSYALENWNIAGVRILPTYHGYDLHAPELDALYEALKKAGLPLYLTINLEDVRNTYMVVPQLLSQSDIEKWLDTHHDVTVLLTGAGVWDINAMEEHIMNHPAAFFDCSGMRQGPFPFERMSEALITRLVYGSMSGILCLKSSLVHFELNEITDEQAACSGNGVNFLAKCPGI